MAQWDLQMLLDDLLGRHRHERMRLLDYLATLEDDPATHGVFPGRTEDERATLLDFFGRLEDERMRLLPNLGRRLEE